MKGFGNCVMKFVKSIGIIILGIIFIISFSCFDLKKMSDKENGDVNLASTYDFSWAKSEKWDKIYVSNVNHPKNRIEIKNKAFLNVGGYSYYFSLFSYIANITEMPTGITDGNDYIYEFVSGKKVYKIKTCGSSAFKYEGKYYSVHSDIEALGEALLPYPRFVATNSVLYKIYSSGAMTNKIESAEYLTLDKVEIKAIANYIQQGLEANKAKLTKNANVKSSEWEERLEFYHYGKKTSIDIYDSYFSITDDNRIYWYKTSNDFDIRYVSDVG